MYVSSHLVCTQSLGGGINMPVNYWSYILETCIKKTFSKPALKKLSYRTPAYNIKINTQILVLKFLG